MTLWPDRWGYPHALLVSLVVVLVVAVAFAGATSAAAFGAYNPAWDGASELRDVAADAGASEALVATNVSAYGEGDPAGTVAVVLSPEQEYTSAETAAVRRFVENGGTLVVAEDYGPHGNALLAGVGSSVRVDGRPLRDEREYYRDAALPVAPNTADHPLTAGVGELTLNHGSVVVAANTSTAAGTTVNATDGDALAEASATVLVRSSEFSYLDADRDGELDDDERLQARPVATVESVGEGRVVVVSDPSLFVNAMLDRGGNRRFASNLFAGADRVLLDYSHMGSQPPLAVAVLALRGSPLLTGLTGLLALAAIGAWRRPETTRAVRSALRSRDDREDTAAPRQEAVAPDEEALLSYLAERYPEWNDARLRRVMTAVLTTDEDRTRDE